MLDQISKLIIEFKKDKRKLEANALILAKSALQGNLKAKKPQKEIDVLRSHVRTLEKGAQAFFKTDKYDELLIEIKTVKALLPTEMKPEYVRLEVERYLELLPIVTKQDMGRAMTDLKSRLGAHNGREISNQVRALSGM